MLPHILTTILLIGCSAAQATDWTQYVDPFLGTEGPSAPGTALNGGNVFPGPVVPFGAVKLGPDATTFDPNIGANAGYLSNGNITGFSLTHVSGTGGGPVYGVVSQMPLASLDGVNLLDNMTYMATRMGNDTDTASVGYFRTKFQNGIVTELAASSHTGFLQYTFPGKENGHILVDLSHYLPSVGGYQAQAYSNGEITVSANGQRYQGYGVYRGAFSNIPSYQVYFCAEFDSAPTSSQVFTGKYIDPYWPSTFNYQPVFGNSSTASGGPLTYQYGQRVGAIFDFNAATTSVKSKVAISWKSTAQACQNLESEITHWNLTTVVADTKQKWNDEVLSTITTTDLSNKTRLTMFYTGLYHAHLMPTDKTGENPHWETSEPTYDDYYTFWDTFRCLNSLMLLILPDRAAGIIRSAIDIWRHETFMPDGRSGFYNGQVQGGSNADNVLADAYVKGLTNGINWTDGYAAMKTDAELTPYNTFDPGDLTASTKEGRGALPDWINLGYVSPTYSRSLSRTVEYALNDFAVAQLAKDFDPESYEKYMNRSAGWQYLWQHDLTSLNFTGFLAPLYANGTRFGPGDYDPLGCGSCEGSSVAYEALPWEYSWTVPFDMDTLIQFMGGPNTTESRLDEMFVPGLRSVDGVGGGGTNGAGTTLFNPGNEPSFSTPLLYNYLQGRQWKTVLRTRQTVNTYYSAEKFGLSGNSDSGALDSWMIWQMLGLYPVATQPVYLIGSPWLSNISMSVGDGKRLVITAANLSDSSYYVQSVKVNGQAWNQSWLSHDDIKNGGTLDFVLGEPPTEWDTGMLPPSPGHVTTDKRF